MKPQNQEEKFRDWARNSITGNEQAILEVRKIVIQMAQEFDRQVAFLKEQIRGKSEPTIPVRRKRASK